MKKDDAQKKMRISFVLPFAGLVGGVRVVAIYAERLKRRGHEVFVVSQPLRRPVLRERLRCLLRDGRLPVPPTSGESFFEGCGVEHTVLDRCGPVTDADMPDADVVVATWWETAPWVAALSPSKGAKAYFVQDYGANSGQAMDKVAQTWHLPLHKITIADWMLDLIQAYCGDTDVSIAHNSVDTDQFFAEPRGKQQRPTVGLMYSTRPQKGLDVKLEALHIARRALPDLHVVAYGTCQQGRDQTLPAGSEYFRNAPQDELTRIYSQCDAWLFGSLLEGFGLPILEAMACRTPVIASPAGAAPELVGQGGGILVGNRDAEGMADAIASVAAMSDEAWRSMSDAAYRTATSYTWDEATDRFEQGLYRAIEKQKLVHQCC